ncbi:MAG: 3-keto-5-aminohexanoate cleavage protein [Candidatus Dadabacteria bacterium]|nr:MAG: 3-keto-5-aminohexanoate cleavage protein [Candidatus Dadabacteria bacterium]
MGKHDKAIISCALTGVLTDPAKFNVPVTPEQMAESARGAFNAGASIMHVHVRRQEPGMGHLPSWNPDDAEAVCSAIREACPGVIINLTTGVFGPDISGPVACLERVRPEMAAMNAGSLNYLRVTSKGTWAWPPALFDNPVEKIEKFLAVMRRLDILPEFECFDTGIVRSVKLYQQVGMVEGHIDVSIIMGVASGMPAKPEWLPLLVEELPEGATWQVIGIGREEVWACHRKAAELGGNLRTGLEDTFYLPDGRRARSNAELVEALVAIARDAGREIASPQEARQMLGLRAAPPPA